MKNYSIIITIIAVLAIGGAGYFYYQYSGMSSAISDCQKGKAEAERQLAEAQDQLSKIKKTNDALGVILESFLIPGDMKALAVGSQEAAKVEQKIALIADSKDRMMMETNWSSFKSSRLLNSLFALLRDASQNIERTMAPKQ